MKKTTSVIATLLILNMATYSQEKKTDKQVKVPALVISAFLKNYADANNITWEKEKGNYEANWGGKSGEDNSALFTPQGKFIEIVKAIPVSDLPNSISTYVSKHYGGSRITEAGKITDAPGKTFYEVEIGGKDVMFDNAGNFIRSEE